MIETDRLLLRDLDASDFEALVSLWTDPDVARFMDDFGPRTRAEVAAWIPDAIAARDGNPKYRTWVMVLKDRDEVIGWIGFGGSSSDLGDIDFAYVVDSAHRGDGYAAEALRAVIAYCFEVLEVASFWGQCHTDNAASAAAMANAGLTFIGTVDGQNRFRAERP